MVSGLLTEIGTYKVAGSSFRAAPIAGSDAQYALSVSVKANPTISTYPPTVQSQVDMVVFETVGVRHKLSVPQEASVFI